MFFIYNIQKQVFHVANWYMNHICVIFFSNHNRSSSNGSSIVSETDSSASFISTRTDTSQYNGKYLLLGINVVLHIFEINFLNVFLLHSSLGHNINKLNCFKRVIV